MASISTTPTPARSDVGAATRPGHAPADPGIRATRRAGVALASGAGIWAAASFVYGFTPDSDIGTKITDLTGLLFQAGVMALLHVQLRTRATGVKAISRRLLKLERVLLSLAMLWSLLHALLPSQREAAWLVALDVFWPLSMFGMFLIGLKIAIAGRWRGLARLWSLLAETWAVATIPFVVLFGHGTGDIVGAAHLVVGYMVLGLILFIRPGLVQDRG